MQILCQKHKPGNQEDEEKQKEEKNLTQNNGSSSLDKDMGEKAYFQEKKNKQFFSFFPTILQCNKVMSILSNNSRMKRHGMKVI